MQFDRNIKNIDLNFSIICPTCNVGAIKSTINSIKNNYSNVSYVCSVPKECKIVDEINGFSPVVVGKNTITSLINAGIKKCDTTWCMVLMEGTMIPKSMIQKYSMFLEKDTDILFPLIVDHDYYGKPMKLFNNFVEGTINGILINSKTFTSIGDFSDNPLEISKFFWSLDAIEKGCVFKSILGVKLN